MEEKLKMVLDALEDGILIFDPSKRLSFINQAAKKFFEIEKESEILGKTLGELSEHKNLQFLFYLLGEDIKEVTKKELELKELILEVSSISLFSGEKIVILKNLTKEKETERLKSEFVSIVAHQLRTPLSSIRWGVEFLSKEKLQPYQKEVVERMKSSIERMFGLLEELFEVLKERGEKIQFERIDFEKIVKEVISSYLPLIEQKKLKFEVKFPQRKLPKIKGDQKKLSFVVQTLLENAISYTKEGGEITLNLNFDQNELKFSIKDTGVGIKKEEQKYIFQRFFRGSGAKKLKTEGTGIALSLAKEIVKNHGGKIWFESEEGKGSTFYFTLPLR